VTKPRQNHDTSISHLHGPFKLKEAVKINLSFRLIKKWWVSVR